MENMREYWAREAEMMRDKSAVLETVNQEVKIPKKNNSDGVKGRYVFDNGGKFLRFEATGQPAVLQVGANLYAFNDPLTDVGAIEYNITKPPKVFKLIKFIYEITSNSILSMMKESNVKLGRNIVSIGLSSVGGELDFSVFHLSQIVNSFQRDYWDFDTEIIKDKGPIFLLPNTNVAHNLLDTGNWLWGNAMKRMGYSLEDALKYAKKYDKNDPNADQRAITSGWQAAKN